VGGNNAAVNQDIGRFRVIIDHKLLLSGSLLVLRPFSVQLMLAEFLGHVSCSLQDSMRRSKILL